MTGEDARAVVDTSVLSRFGGIRRVDLLEAWAPLLAPVSVLAEVERSARGAIAASCKRLRTSGVLVPSPPPSEERDTALRALDKHARLSEQDLEVLALGLERGLPVLSDDQALCQIGAEAGADCYDVVDILGALKEGGRLDRAGMKRVIEELERQPSPRRFRRSDREELLRY